ncbi:hypothetical protein SPONL_2198 [uncultured Candidatus Thioglobus sp.]|nr:hypothetical protein SPONL_2198 [uncultured Candidatus Thioglobus sp.]
MNFSFSYSPISKKRLKMSVVFLYPSLPKKMVQRSLEVGNFT